MATELETRFMYAATAVTRIHKALEVETDNAQITVLRERLARQRSIVSLLSSFQCIEDKLNE